MYTKNSYSIMPRTIGGLIEDIFQNGFTRVLGDDSPEKLDSAPVNITETEKSYDLQVIAPGLKKEEFKVGVDRNVLTISYEHKEESNEQTLRSLRTEYKMRSFKRSFTLNEKIDANTIGARYVDGVLHVTLPKKEQTDATPQQISVG